MQRILKSIGGFKGPKSKEECKYVPQPRQQLTGLHAYQINGKEVEGTYLNSAMTCDASAFFRVIKDVILRQGK